MGFAQVVNANLGGEQGVLWDLRKKLMTRFLVLKTTSAPNNEPFIFYLYL